jgi:hypothetical protein
MATIDQFLEIFSHVILNFFFNITERRIGRDMNKELQKAGQKTIKHTYDIWHFIKV